MMNRKIFGYISGIKGLFMKNIRFKLIIEDIKKAKIMLVSNRTVSRLAKIDPGIPDGNRDGAT
jgi:hypothetical protein